MAGHSKRLRELIRYRHFDISERHVRCARRAYYGMIRFSPFLALEDRMTAAPQAKIPMRSPGTGAWARTSYVDDKVGELLAALEVTGLLTDTVVIFTAHHGDMLGERNLWFDMALYEMSARVPLIISCPARFNGAVSSGGAGGGGERATKWTKV